MFRTWGYLNIISPRSVSPPIFVHCMQTSTSLVGIEGDANMCMQLSLGWRVTRAWGIEPQVGTRDTHTYIHTIGPDCTRCVVSESVTSRYQNSESTEMAPACGSENWW